MAVIADELGGGLTLEDATFLLDETGVADEPGPVLVLPGSSPPQLVAAGVTSVPLLPPTTPQLVLLGAVPLVLPGVGVPAQAVAGPLLPPSGPLILDATRVPPVL